MFGIVSVVCQESQKIFTGPGKYGNGRLVRMGKTSSWVLSYQKKTRDDVQLDQQSLMGHASLSRGQEMFSKVADSCLSSQNVR